MSQLQPDIEAILNRSFDETCLLDNTSEPELYSDEVFVENNAHDLMKPAPNTGEILQRITRILNCSQLNDDEKVKKALSLAAAGSASLQSDYVDLDRNDSGRCSQQYLPHYVISPGLNNSPLPKNLSSIHGDNSMSPSRNRSVSIANKSPLLMMQKRRSLPCKFTTTTSNSQNSFTYSKVSKLSDGSRAASSGSLSHANLSTSSTGSFKIHSEDQKKPNTSCGKGPLKALVPVSSMSKCAPQSAIPVVKSKNKNVMSLSFQGNEFKANNSLKPMAQSTPDRTTNKLSSIQPTSSPLSSSTRLNGSLTSFDKKRNYSGNNSTKSTDSRTNSSLNRSANNYSGVRKGYSAGQTNASSSSATNGTRGILKNEKLNRNAM